MKLTNMKVITFFVTLLMCFTLFSHESANAKTEPINIDVPYINSQSRELYVNQGGWLSGYRTGEEYPYRELKWASSDPSILKLYSGSKGCNECAFVAKKSGTVTVTATDSSGYKEKINITVAEKSPDGINLNKQTITSKGETAVLYYQTFTINNNLKFGSGLLVDLSGNLCVSMEGILKESETIKTYQPQDSTGSWIIYLTSKSFIVNAGNTYDTKYSAAGYYDETGNCVLESARYCGIFRIKSKKYRIDQTYTAQNGWQYSKYKYYNNRQLMVRYAYYELIKNTKLSGEAIPNIENYTLNYQRAQAFRNEFEKFDLTKEYKTNDNTSAKYGEDTSKPSLIINEGTELACALEKYCGVFTVDELPFIMPIDRNYYYWTDLCVGTFDNYYVIVSGEKAGTILYADDDGNGVKDEHGVMWYSTMISN